MKRYLPDDEVEDLEQQVEQLQDLELEQGQRVVDEVLDDLVEMVEVVDDEHQI